MSEFRDFLALVSRTRIKHKNLHCKFSPNVGKMDKKNKLKTALESCVYALFTINLSFYDQIVGYSIMVMSPFIASPHFCNDIKLKN